MLLFVMLVNSTSGFLHSLFLYLTYTAYCERYFWNIIFFLAEDVLINNWCCICWVIFF